MGNGEFIKSTIGADEFTRGIIVGYNQALKDNAKQYSEVKLGEIFTVEGKKYMITKPSTPNKVNEHGQVVIVLTDL
jgi:hypothetical protein